MRSLYYFRSMPWAVLALIFINLSGCVPAKYDGLSKMRFSKVSGQIPVIEGRINGKRAHFIIDTGASCSILNESRSDHFGFGYCSRVDYKDIYGLGGNASINQALNCMVEVGPLKIRHLTFRTKHLDYLTKVISRQDNVEIAGIIGSDIFNRYGISIDFKHNMILFNR